jgi:hypothetical protein
MPKKRATKTDGRVLNRVMVSLDDEDYAKVTERAEEENLPVATFLRLVILGKRTLEPATV